MLNYMILTVVANGHNCIATATAGYAQGRCHDFTLVATVAECQSIFSQLQQLRRRKPDAAD